MGVDFGYQMSASAAFKSLADAVPAYDGLRYPHLKDESRPVQVKHILSNNVLAQTIADLKARVAGLPDTAEKNMEMPKVGHKLFRITTMTGKTEQFHLLANGNPKPEDRLVSPLYSFNLDGTPREEEQTAAA
jgi:hypothetical protein